MPRVRRQLKSPIQSVRRVRKANAAGQPGVGLTTPGLSPQRKGFDPVTGKPIYAKRRLRLLHKVDVSKGITMPEAQGITTTRGVDTGRGFATRATQIVKAKIVPSNRNSRVITPPRQGGGVIQVFGKNRAARGKARRRR